MRVVLIAHQFFPDSYGGVETVTYKLAHYLKDHGYSVHILCHRLAGRRANTVDIVDDTYANLPVRRLVYNPDDQAPEEHWTLDDAEIAACVKHTLEEWKPDLIHALGFSTVTAATVSEAKKRGIPIICSITNYESICKRGDLIHGDGTLCEGPQTFWACWNCNRPTSKRSDLVYKFLSHLPRHVVVSLSRLNQWVPRPLGVLETARLVDLRLNKLLSLLSQVDLFIVMSDWMRKILIRNGISGERIVVSPHGIEPVAIVSKSAASHIRFGFLGRFAPLKGVHVLIEAFQRLPRPRGATLTLYGAPNRYEKAYTRELRRLAGGCPRIRFGGLLDIKDVPRVMQDIDVLVVPSVWHEPFGLTNIEALTTRTPVIASKIGGIPEIIQDGVNGLLFPPGDVTALCDRMQRCIDDPSFVQGLTQSIRSWRTLNDEMAAIIRIYGVVLDKRDFRTELV